ncbi:hypothetical protein GIB67_021364 [Kingdonia uniflora]|uniref:Uncharacterized protein n=1 Tax=Kingdonia uniflora TaxID=39325 RepID=A0A7J7MD61_9MAGN|nr:hypothetical protein GIB67_021364 [Kingdonia uniflora]
MCDCNIMWRRLSIYQLGGGDLFGLPVGIVADSLGTTIGAATAFLLGRTLLKWTFDWECMVRGLVLDKKTSLILKVNYLASLDYRFYRANIILYQALFIVE